MFSETRRHHERCAAGSSDESSVARVFFQAEDGIRDKLVTGVQTCALPISECKKLRLMTIRSEGQFNTVVYEDYDLYRGVERRDVILIHPADIAELGLTSGERVVVKIGRASCRERVKFSAVSVAR